MKASCARLFAEWLTKGRRMSVRARLTLWYSIILALTLLAFASSAFLLFINSSDAQIDKLLAEAASALEREINNAQTESNAGSDAELVAREASDFQMENYRLFVYDANARLIFAPNSQLPWASRERLTRKVESLLARASRDGKAYASLRLGGEEWRAFARTLKFRGQTYEVLALRSLHDRHETLQRLRLVFLAAIPLSLLLAGFGGYFLARRSLAPVSEMSARAASISAANLDERLPIINEHDELGQLAAVINGLLARLQTSFEQQRRFMADASHELRTPVAIICGEAEVALSRGDRSSEELRESLEIVYDEGRRMARIVEDLLLLARADAGQYPLAPTNFYLDELLEEVVHAMRTLAAHRGVKLCAEYDRELIFNGDENLIRRMLINLLDNAIKYTKRASAVRAICKRDSTHYVITISDAGPGIPPEAQSRIFERFWRLDPARSRSEMAGAGSGAGLGLSIAAWIAAVHGGKIELVRSDETGSTFAARLPLRSELAAQNQVAG
ncbi:sensor histidine kinase [Pyrinomonas methylaliphatogenes]|jgi:heavy metal sensor kinase|uniref:histidine kinase n=1 Tax=Pyrinomonas methylaliphatogenes TaxID=454194 RepID=A0A0B6WT98_9BACT|nr:ATP-binding protein [Pyrinomonas methylaliphatogenes]CDM64241.1 signal transduction histidine kinase [Pyrinomonas methylaliphatogenes]